MVSKAVFPNKSKETASRLIDNEAVIVILKDNEVKVLNEVGSRIWDLLDGKKDINQIAVIISEEFDVSCDEALKDITIFIDDLCQKNMVVVE